MVLTSLVVGLVISFLTVGVPAVVWAADSYDLNVMGSVDTIGEFGFGETGGDHRRVALREAELAFYGHVDHLFEGFLSAAAHQESGQMLFEVHEGYIGSSKLVHRSRLKFGQYFLGIGRLNRFHRHDWPFVSTPLVHSTLLDNEGVVDTGLEWSWLTPLPFYLDLTFGATSGYTFGHTHSEGTKPQVPTLYFRPATFIETGPTSGAEVGFTTLYRRDSAGTEMRLFGADFTQKVREGRTLTFLLQSEIWYRQFSSADSSKSFGTYLYPELALGSQWSTGTRFDYFRETSNEDYQIAAVPTLTFKNSEFSRFRLEYNHQLDVTSAASTLTPVVRFQATFLLGAHPAHDF